MLTCILQMYLLDSTHYSWTPPPFRYNDRIVLIQVGLVRLTNQNTLT